MSSAKALNNMSDDQLIDFMTRQDSAGRWGPDQAATNRDAAKAILDVRSAKVIQQQNQIMIKLTNKIEGLTWVLVVITAILLFKALCPNFNLSSFIKNFLLRIQRLTPKNLFRKR